ncbi:hypothetical protein EI94DRAFT_1670260 [Lactarius quietus]|nr:hypothetical protein EI94DRAFT_1670260 [Lactarius quietus]
MENHSIAELAKEKGNVAFKKQDYATAISLYSHAMSFDRSNPFYPLNRSFSNLKLARWDEAEADATQTLVLSPRNLKAFFRRGVARKELRKWDQARADIQMFIDNGGDPTIGAQEFKAITDLESSPSPNPSSHTCNTSGDLDSGLANLHLQDDDSSIFTIHTSTAVQEGKGAFASRDIQRGDLILSEKPILSILTNAPEPLKRISIEAAARKLSPVHLDELLSLSNSHTACTCFRDPFLGIYGTNSFTFTDDDSGICLKASRFNHSCNPNARFSFNSNTGELRIYALGTIPRGEEIFVAYISSRRLYGNTRRSRQGILRARYHFTCACSVCSLPEAESKKSDARRVKLNELWDIIPSFTPFQGIQRLNVIVEAIHLLKEEGYLADADDYTNDAGLVCAFHSDWVSAKYWTGLTYRIRVAEFGEDSPRAAEVRGPYLNPGPFRWQDADLLRSLLRFECNSPYSRPCFTDRTSNKVYFFRSSTVTSLRGVRSGPLGFASSSMSPFL